MDKREAVRVPVRVHARCRLETGVVVDGLVEDVSRSGLFIMVAAEGPLACGSQTSIVLDLPDEQAVQLEAEVVRVEDSGVGLRFVETSTSETPSRSLANFIMKRAFDVRS